MSIKIDPEGPRRSKKDPVRVRKLRQTSQAAFAASSFSSWFFVSLISGMNLNKNVKLVEEMDILFGNLGENVFKQS